MLRMRTILPLVLVLAGGCAANGQQPRPDPDLLTRAEIMSTDVSNLYEVVHRLRPRWLTAERRAGERSLGHLQTRVVVFQNQTYLGGLEALRQWSPSSAYELEWLDGATASATLPGLGSQHVAGAIVIRTSPQ